ncbi:GNAT family N-acetyltransferase [Ramlibacter sp.]|uniref:GNAT family N-acetyltransferase n=1 Tax=Ramlibacter sp. TaxID=1917967 RepID=UPI003D0B547E
MDLSTFRTVLAQHLGAELTPERCAAIEDALFRGPDRSVDPMQFEPILHHDYIVQVESFRAIMEELKPLHAAHWSETEFHRHGLPFNPDYEGVAARERAGRAVQFTVRREGELVGQLLMYLFTSTHTQTPVSEEDCLFIRPDHRGGMLVMKLLRYAERVLHQIQGPHLIRTSSKLVNRADVLMRRMGYQPFALQFFKFTGESHVL